MSLYGFVYGFASVAGQIGEGLDHDSALRAGLALDLFDQRSHRYFGIPRCLVLCAREPPCGSRSRIDGIGVTLLLLVIALIIIPLTQGREAGWPAWTFLSLAGSIPTLGLFLLAEFRLQRNKGDPLVDLNLFRNPVFSMGLILAFCFYCDSVFFLTYGIYLQRGLHWSPLEAGVAIFPFGVGSILGPLFSPGLVRRLGNRILTVGFGLLTAGCATAAAALVDTMQPTPPFYLGLLFAGMGHGIVLPSVVRIVIGEIEPAKAGLASGVVTSMLQIGSAFGAHRDQWRFLSRLSTESALPDYVHAYQVVLGILSVLFLACTGLSTKLAHRQS